MLTRDTCRSVDFTAWRVCPYTHTHTHLRFRRNLVFIRARYGFREQHERTGGGRKAVVARRVTRVCARRWRDVSRFQASVYIYARLYTVTYGRVGGWLRDCIGWLERWREIERSWSCWGRWQVIGSFNFGMNFILIIEIAWLRFI